MWTLTAAGALLSSVQIEALISDLVLCCQHVPLGRLAATGQPNKAADPHAPGSQSDYTPAYQKPGATRERWATSGMSSLVLHWPMQLTESEAFLSP